LIGSPVSVIELFLLVEAVARGFIIFNAAVGSFAYPVSSSVSSVSFLSDSIDWTLFYLIWILFFESSGEYVEIGSTESTGFLTLELDLDFDCLIDFDNNFDLFELAIESKGD